MRVKNIRLKDFKRFDDLTIDLGNSPKKIVALVGPNGCGKSSIFDAFEEKLKDFRNHGNEGVAFLSKSLYHENEIIRSRQYNKNESIAIETTTENIARNGFYIRTAYRFTSKINVKKIEAMPGILASNDEPISSISLDTRLESNYKRLLGSAYSEFFSGKKTGNTIKEELIGRINGILNSVIDAEISDLGEIMGGRGQLYFKKGNSKDFPYSNLSSGEKEVVDIIIDLIVKANEYSDTVICIDEPELHLNTAIQRKLLVEIEKLIPDNCQLWVATHSIGFLRALQDELKDKAQILDFSEKDYFSGPQKISPIVPNRSNWQRIFSTALEDLTVLLSPKRIIYCEGRDTPGAGGAEKGLDARVYNNIFSEKYNDTLFISSGGSTELDQRSEIAIKILTKVFSDVEILVLKDRDMSSGRLNTANDRKLYLENNPFNHRVIVRWEIENYLFDKEVLTKYCSLNNLSFDEAAYSAYVTDIENQNIKDEFNRIKNFCGIKTPINSEVFKINLSKIITADMSTYQELESCIFTAAHA
jgi:predicted ATP-binding protein involved in virulence